MLFTKNKPLLLRLIVVFVLLLLSFFIVAKANAQQFFWPNGGPLQVSLGGVCVSNCPQASQPVWQNYPYQNNNFAANAGFVNARGATPGQYFAGGSSWGNQSRVVLMSAAPIIGLRRPPQALPAWVGDDYRRGDMSTMSNVANGATISKVCINGNQNYQVSGSVGGYDFSVGNNSWRGGTTFSLERSQYNNNFSNNFCY